MIQSGTIAESDCQNNHFLLAICEGFKVKSARKTNWQQCYKVLLLFQDGCYIPNDGVNFTTAGNSATPGDYGEMPTGSDMR